MGNGIMGGMDASAIRSEFTIHPKAKAPAYHSEGETLGEVYGRYSSAKDRAFRYCKDLCESVGGTGFCISSHNTFGFTVMFDFENPDDGRMMRAHITKAHNHAYYLD